MKRVTSGKSEDSSKKQKTVDSEKKFDDFLGNLQENEMDSLEYFSAKSTLHVGLENKNQFRLVFSDSMVKLERDETNEAFSKSEAGKSEKELISKYFQIIIEKSADFLKNIKICSKDFPFSSTNIKNCKNLEKLNISHNGESFDLIKSGFLGQENIFQIREDIWIHGVSLDGGILDFEKMKAKDVSCDKVTGSVFDVLFNYLNKFQEDKIENIFENIDLEMIPEEVEMVSDEEDEDEEYYGYPRNFRRDDYPDYEILHQDFESIFGEFENNGAEIDESECFFEISNKTNQFKIECHGNNFNMSEVEKS